MVEEYLLKLGLPGIMILGLGVAVIKLYADLQKTQNARVEDMRERADGERKRPR